MNKYNLHHGNCLDVLKTFQDNSVDSIVTDPPYGISFMGKTWDYDVPSVDIWIECLRVLKPGGYLLAFAGTKTQHRMAINIEDAGFEIRDMIAWVYGSGFPKSSNAALKPAMEPITMARKPLIGSVAKNVLAYGTGALNIDGCRVVAEDGGRPLREVAPLRDDVQYNANSLSGRVDGSLASSKAAGLTNVGRWPANIIHDGSDEVLDAFPNAPGQQGDLLSHDKLRQSPNGIFGTMAPAKDHKARVDQDKSAARFFYCAKASKADRDEGLEDFQKEQGVFFQTGNGASGKPSSIEQSRGARAPRANNHPTVKPTDLMRYLCRLVTPPSGIVLDPFMGSGSTGKAAMFEGLTFIGIELDSKYMEIAQARIEAALQDQGGKLAL